MAVLKVLEILASSNKSWEDAANTALDKAASSVKNVRSGYVQEQSIAIKEDGSREFRVNVKITFEVE